MVVQKAKILLQKVTARKKSLLAAQSTALLLGEINDIASQFEDLKVSQNGIFCFLPEHVFKVRNQNTALL